MVNSVCIIIYSTQGVIMPFCKRKAGINDKTENKHNTY